MNWLYTTELQETGSTRPSYRELALRDRAVRHQIHARGLVRAPFHTGPIRAWIGPVALHGLPEVRLRTGGLRGNTDWPRDSVIVDVTQLKTRVRLVHVVPAGSVKEQGEAVK